MTQPDRISYSVAQACQTTGMSRSWLYERIKDGKLRAKKAGGRTFILHEDLVALMRGMEDLKHDDAA